MGQSNEENQPWAGLLPNMGEDPSVWIKKLLLDAGFSKVEDLGMTDSYRSTSKKLFCSIRLSDLIIKTKIQKGINI